MKSSLRDLCLHLFLVMSAVLFLTAGTLCAKPQQTTSATIQGNVLDVSGSAVPKATVVASNEATNQRQQDTTDQQGHFSISGLAPGSYTVDVTAVGFATDDRKGLQLAGGQTQDLSITLRIGAENEAVIVEAIDSPSIAAHIAPMDALLDEHTARTEIKPIFVSNFTSPVADFGELVEMAPGTFSESPNGIGLTQDKTYFRGFPDGDYDIDFDGVPFYDTNTPTHHTWAFFPPPWVGGVDFDRSPGSASTIGPTPFGGSIHLLSPGMLGAPLLTMSVSYGSFNTVFADAHFDSGPFTGAKSNLSIDVQHMQSDGYETFDYQTRNAGSLKYVYKFSDNNVLTGYSGVVWLDSNTSNNSPTRGQLAIFGANFVSNNNCVSVALCGDEDSSGNTSPYALFYYKFYTYHVPTDFEYVDWNRQFGHGWQMDFKPYTLSYYNEQYYANPTFNTTNSIIDGMTYGPGTVGTCPGDTLSTAAATVGTITTDVLSTCAVDKLNSYRKYGEILSVDQVSKYGTLRVGLWYEWATTNRYQIPSDPLTHVDANLPNFHENFWTNSAQPYVEYEWQATSRLTVTAGFKYSYFEQSLKQYQDNGKTVGCLGGTLVGNAKTTANDSCNGGSPFTTHGAGYSSYLPSADANYRILPIWSVYGQYATGTIVPPSSVFDVTGANVVLTPKPTGALTFQGGSVLKIKQLTLNADYYHTHFQNTYVSIPDPDNASAVDYTQGGDTVTKGFEGEANLYLTHGFGLYANGTAGSAHYVTDELPSKGLWVANTPASTQAVGLTWQQKHFEVGFFDKRIGDMWNDNSATINVPAATSSAPGTITITNPDGYSVTYTNTATSVDKIKITANQTILIQPFNVANFYFNFTLKNGSRFDGTKFRFTVNNLFNSHSIVSDSQAIAGCAGTTSQCTTGTVLSSSPWFYGGGSLISGVPIS